MLAVGTQAILTLIRDTKEILLAFETLVEILCIHTDTITVNLPAPHIYEYYGSRSLDMTTYCTYTFIKKPCFCFSIR